MLRNLTLFLLVALCACGSRQTKPTAIGADSTGAELAIDTAVSADFYKRYSGTIGGRPVVLHLQYVNGGFEGSYQFKSQGNAITFREYNDSTDDEVHELIDLTQNEGASWTLTVTGTTANGIWKDPKSGARLPISLNEDYPAGSIRLQAFSVEDSMSLFPDKPEGAKAISQYVYLQSAGAGKLNELLNMQIFPDYRAGEELQKSIRKANQSYFDSYRDDNQALGQSSETAGFTLNYDQRVSQQVLFNDNDWLVVELFTNSYTGGAHGNYSSGYINIDRTLNRVWSLTDMVQDTTALRPLLNEAAIVYFGIKPGGRIGDRLFVDEVPVSTNVYLSATGLCFVYNPYEIASYAEGQIKLFIPFTRLQPYLQPLFRERMHLSEQSGGVQRI